MTEESIDTERMMLGIDDAGNHSINWIRCADRMPPDDVGYQIIIKFKTGRPMPCNAQQLNRVKDPNVEWIPFSWSNLNAADKEWEQSKLSK